MSETTGRDAMIVERVDLEAFDRHLPALAAMLEACVAAGASIGFVQPFTLADSEHFWRETVRPALAREARALFVARRGEVLLGSGQLIVETPANQRHRAEITKLIVDPRHRRQGAARALMTVLEAEAVRHGRWLITLDTRTGDAAEPLYRSVGFVEVGAIPFYAEAPAEPRYDATTVMFKLLRTPGADHDTGSA